MSGLEIITSQILIHILAVTDLDDEDHEPLTLNRVDHPVLPNAQPIETFLTVQELDPWRTGILPQGVDLSGDLSLGILRESSEFPFGSLEELDGVGQTGGLTPQASLHLFPGNPNPVLRIG